MRKRLKYKIIGLSTVAIIILIFVSLQITGMASIENVNNTIENAKYFGPILYILILIIHGIVSIFPAAAIVLFGGKYFGVANGLVYTITGMTIGASAAFFIAKNTLVFIRNSIKTINKKTIFEKNKITIKTDEKKETKTSVTKETTSTKVEQK